jgi:hypothetical protein
MQSGVQVSCNLYSKRVIKIFFTNKHKKHIEVCTLQNLYSKKGKKTLEFDLSYTKTHMDTYSQLKKIHTINLSLVLDKRIHISTFTHQI